MQQPPKDRARTSRWPIAAVIVAVAICLMIAYVNLAPGPYQTGYDAGGVIVSIAERRQRPLNSFVEALDLCTERGLKDFADVNELGEFQRGCLDRIEERYDLERAG